MQIARTEILSKPGDKDAPAFSHVRNSLACSDMHVIRGELAEFLRHRGIQEAHIGNLLLALTEILSNLVKHPVMKADYIEIRVSVEDMRLEMEVLDNSSPFADFDAKCKIALSMMRAAETEAECGYGLGCILSLYKNPDYIPGELSRDRLNHFRIIHDICKITATAPPKQKIFLVDDDNISLKIHQRMLEGIYDVTAFKKAEDALEAFPQYKPDLIISDLTMPGMDGIALRKELAKIKDGDTTPFVFLSGHANNEHNHYISHLGVDDYLCKPVMHDRLHNVLTRLLHRSRQVRASLQGQFNRDITDLLRPVMPKDYGQWKFITRFKAAETGGGDFILYNQTPTNMMTILADVMGHDRQAKFFSYVYAGYLRSMFRMQAGTLDASNFLRYLSQSIDGDPLLESMIMTCLCFQFYPSGVLRIASAGHPRPIILRRNNTELVDVTGPLPGLVADNPYRMKSICLGAGDKIIFMTDGFMEVFDRRGHAAQELLKRAHDFPGATAEDLADFLWQAFHAHLQKQSTNHDDATIIIAEYTGDQHEYK